MRRGVIVLLSVAAAVVGSEEPPRADPEQRDALLIRTAFEGALDARIAADPHAMVAELKGERAWPDPVRLVVANKILRQDGLTYEESGWLFGVIYNIQASYATSEAVWTLQAYYESLPPDVADRAVLLKLRDLGWRIDDVQFVAGTRDLVRKGAAMKPGQIWTPRRSMP